MDRRLPLAAALAVLIPVMAAAQAPATDTAKKVEQQHEEMTLMQSLQRLQTADESISEAIEQLGDDAALPKADRSPTDPATAAKPGEPEFLADDPARHAAVLQAEQALHEVRRAVDEIGLDQRQRLRVLDRLDDADSALRMARQPDALKEQQRLIKALEAVQSEVRTAQKVLPTATAKQNGQGTK